MSGGMEMEEGSADEEQDALLGLDDEQKRRLRALRRGYRAKSVEVKDNGWLLEITFMDGSKVQLNSKLLKLKADQLRAPD